MARRRIGTAVPGSYANENIFRRGFGVFHEDVKVSIFGEDSGIHQFVLGLQARPLCIFLNKLIVRKCSVRVFVEALQIRACRRGIEIKIVFLYVLAMISLGAGEAEKAFLQDRVFLIPERNSETDVLVPIAEAGNAVFAPAISSRTRMIVRKIVPGVAIRAVILANCSPLAL